MALAIGSLFAGIGGFELGLERTGGRVEDEYRRVFMSKNLSANWGRGRNVR